MDKSDFVHFVNSVRWHCIILRRLRDSMGTLTGLSGEYVTFDQNLQEDSFGWLVSNPENWKF